MKPSQARTINSSSSSLASSVGSSMDAIVNGWASRMYVDTLGIVKYAFCPGAQCMKVPQATRSLILIVSDETEVIVAHPLSVFDLLLKCQIYNVRIRRRRRSNAQRL